MAFTYEGSGGLGSGINIEPEALRNSAKIAREKARTENNPALRKYLEEDANWYEKQATYNFDGAESD